MGGPLRDLRHSLEIFSRKFDRQQMKAREYAPAVGGRRTLFHQDSQDLSGIHSTDDALSESGEHSIGASFPVEQGENRGAIENHRHAGISVAESGA